jgi:RNA polymerase-binding transcription factor DksA
MTTKELQKFKTRLIAERKIITAQIHDHEEEEKSLQRGDDEGLDYDGDDPAVEHLEKLTNIGVRSIKKIDLSLDQIDNDSYGKFPTIS